MTITTRTRNLITSSNIASPSHVDSVVNHVKDRPVKKSDVILLLIVMLISGGATALDLALSIGLLFATIVLATYKLARQQIIPKRSSGNAAVALMLISLVFLVKYAFGDTDQLIFKYGLYFLNIFTALLVLMVYARKPMYLIKVIHAALLVFLLHAILSFFLWFFVKNNLQYVESLETFTFGYLFFYGHAETLDGLSASVNLFGIEFRRNYGMFWEPGILQIYINLLLFLSLFVFQSKKVALACIFVITTTWSSTGLFTLALQLLYFAYLNVKQRHITFFLAITVPLVALISMLALTNLDEKLYGKDAGSGYARALDTFTAVNIVAANPLFGIPLDSGVWERERMEHFAIIQMEGTRDTRDPSDTNSILNYFVFFGLPIGILILTMFYMQRLFMVHKHLFFVILCVSLSTEPLGFTVFFLMFALSTVVISDSWISRRPQCVSPH